MASDAQLALLNAIMNGEAESLEEIVRRGADVNAVGTVVVNIKHAFKHHCQSADRTRQRHRDCILTRCALRFALTHFAQALKPATLHSSVRHNAEKQSA